MRMICYNYTGIITAILFTIACVPVHADNSFINSGILAYTAGDFASAYTAFSVAANSGDANAQTYLGSLYFVGEGAPQDYAQAAQWYTQAAEQGQPGAQLLLAGLYYCGQGVPKSYVQAYVLYTAAAYNPSASNDVSTTAMGQRTSLIPLLDADQMLLAQRSVDAWASSHPLKMDQQPSVQQSAPPVGTDPVSVELAPLPSCDQATAKRTWTAGKAAVAQPAQTSN